MRYEVNTYRSTDKAIRATALRSRNASIRGDCSQFEVRQLGEEGFAGGPTGEMAKRFPTARIVRQYSGGYSV